MWRQINRRADEKFQTKITMVRSGCALRHRQHDKCPGKPDPFEDHGHDYPGHGSRNPPTFARRPGRVPSKLLPTCRILTPENRSRIGADAGRSYAASIRITTESTLAQVSPGMQLIVVLEPAIANVRSVVHIRNQDIPDPLIGLCLRLFY